MPPQWIEDDGDDSHPEESEEETAIHEPKSHAVVTSSTKSSTKPAASVNDGGEDEEEEEEEEDDDDDDDDEEGSEQEYVVEQIVKHKAEKGAWLYRVKWEGWTGANAYTWEPESNLDNAKDLVAAYWEQQGGRQNASDPKGKKRRISQADNDTPSRANANGKRPREIEGAQSMRPKVRVLPPGSWEAAVAVIETMEQKENPAVGSPDVDVNILWNGDEQPVRTVHSLELIRKKCPQLLIDFFLNRLVFKDSPAEEYGGAR